jgi:electron transfer flavoprotein alpha subunit
MNKDIYVICDMQQGAVTEISLEMAGKARALADASGGRALAVLLNHDTAALAAQCGPVDAVYCIEHPDLQNPTPEACVKALAAMFTVHPPGLIFIGATSLGLDVASQLATQLSIPMVSSCKDVALEGDTCIATSQVYGGKIMVETEIAIRPALLSILPGAFPPAPAAGTGTLEIHAVEFGPIQSRMRFVRSIPPPAGDVDITKAPILVSVGRGMQNADNLAIAHELAEILGGAVSASRPVVDQGWLPMTRQVGRSGMIVKPKLYLACGISGAPEHVEGIRDAELIIAVNTDLNTPIFKVAHFGVVGDALDFLPALTEALQEHHARKA